MQRHHLMEMHEQPWYPDALRTMTQDTLGKTLHLLRVYRSLVDPMATLLRHTHATAILDMCSGSAELIVRLCQQATACHADLAMPRIVLSDLYPNQASFERQQRAAPGTVDYLPTPVDARSPPHGAQVPRVRTLLNCLHHFKPHDVHDILRDAALNADGIGVFEGTDRSWRSLLSTPLLAPATAVISSCMLRPWQPKHALFGALMPLVPATLVMDGVVSNLRTYKRAELQAMIDDIDAADFMWDIQSVPMHTAAGPRVNYLLGWRV